MEIQKINPLNGATSKLKSLAADAKEAEGSIGFMEPEIPLRKSGRHKTDCQCERCKVKRNQAKPTGATSQTPGQVDPQASKKLAEPLFRVLSDLAVEKTGEKSAAMSPAQIDTNSTLGGALIDKYFPNGMAQWGLEIGLGISVGMWGLGVFMIYRDKSRALRDEAERRSRGSGYKTAEEARANAAPRMPDPRQPPEGDGFPVSHI